MRCQGRSQLPELFGWGYFILAQRISQPRQSLSFAAHVLNDLRPFFLLVLSDNLRIEVLDRKVHERKILFEELRLIHFDFSFKKLLIEIDRANAELIIVEVGCNYKNEIVGPHITQQTHEATFIEFDKILGTKESPALASPNNPPPKQLL